MNAKREDEDFDLNVLENDESKSFDELQNKMTSARSHYKIKGKISEE